ncbi:MAG: TIGR03915 family putative DNA repair protein [Lachnospiraceae bacterium]|nr:TIGR03915 family putative DNA repair protein [Lachnospiraceae bacterium]
MEVMNDNNKVVFVCENEFVAIMTAIYDAWDWSIGKGHDKVHIELEGERNYQLFTEYIEVKPNEEKCRKVVRSIRNKISEEVFGEVFLASLSEKKDKADAIYHFLVVAFKIGSRVLDSLGNPCVMRVFELVRYVKHEAGYSREFLRFSKLSAGGLFAKIKPKNDIITLIAPHFADRLPEENWIIYDEGRKIAVVHPRGSEWFITNDKVFLDNIVFAEDELEYQELWKVFFKTIAIKERINYKLQRQVMPLRYRENVVEFK